ncbi:hypothetical protein K458DRAFT_313478, partial [Lentithecium fluviatile CBS 122367]
EGVNFNKNNAPKNYFIINIRLAYKKLLKYYLKLNNLPAYFIATSLYSYYKYYFKNA